MSKKYIVLVILVTSVVAFVTGAVLFSGEYDDTGLPYACNVLIVPVNGYLDTYKLEDEFDVTSSDDVIEAISLAQSEEQIKALILSVDSYGGAGVAGEEVANALKSFSKPSVSVIRRIGASSAYWAVTGSDTIFASSISDVGSIGVTASYLDESIKNTNEGYTRIELTSAPFKDLGDPARPVSEEERAIVIADLNKMHEIFIDNVATNRNLERTRVAELANGLTYVGIDALEYGLIDEIGDISTAKSYIEEQIGEDVEACWY